MNVREAVLQRAKDYINNKEYQLTLVQDSKIRKPKEEKKLGSSLYICQRGSCEIIGL